MAYRNLPPAHDLLRETLARLIALTLVYCIAAQASDDEGSDGTTNADLLASSSFTAQELAQEAERQRKIAAQEARAAKAAEDKQRRAPATCL